MIKSQIQPSPWSLSDLFNSFNDPKLISTFNDLENLVSAFENYRSKLSADIPVQKFLEIVKELEKITQMIYRIHSFGSLSFAADTQDQKAQVFLAKVEQLAAETQNRTMFFSLWWKELEDQTAENLMSEAGDLRYWLEEMRHFKPYTLSEAEEKIINLKDVTGASALNTLYDSITNRYIFRLSIDGAQEELTRGQLMVYVRQHDPDLRAQAYQELYRVYGQDSTILGLIYQTLVRDWRNEQIDLRGYKNPIAVRNLANDIPDEVVEILLDVCERNSTVFQEYFRNKARLLGMENLRRYDIYAPVVKADKLYEFSTAINLVLESFHDFSPRLAALAQRVIDKNHLDSEVRKGKRDGAFCATVTPDLTPWVLVNYQRRAEDVATLAHEFGHAIHAMLAEHHSVFTQHSSLPLAETASTFGEMMLIDRLLLDETDQGVRRDLLFKQVDDAYATILRQAFFAMFERKAHTLVRQDGSIDDLCEAYLENLKRQFGEAVEISDEFRWEWVSIPHIFHVPFYVYAYAFGQLLVLSLYQQYKQEGETFKPRYLDILAAGGSESPVNILSKAGIDVYNTGFWQGGFNVINDMVHLLESLPG